MKTTDTKPYVDRGDYVEFAIDGHVTLGEAVMLSQTHGFPMVSMCAYRVRNGLTTWKCEKKGGTDADGETNGRTD